MKPTSVVIVDPNQLFREGLRQLLRKPRFVVTAAVRTAAEVLGAAATVAEPDIVIFGCGTDVGTDWQAALTRDRGAKSARTRFVLLTDVTELPLLRRAVASGVEAILSKDISSEVLQRSLELVMLGQQLFPAALAQSQTEKGVALPQADLIPFPSTGAAATAAPIVKLELHKPGTALDLASLDQQRGVTLSERESQILQCLVNGLSNKAIARELRITEATVKVHVKGLLRKVRASNRTQAAIWAMNNRPVARHEPGHVMDLPLAGAQDRRASA